jgi:hypothetical protein
VQHPAIVCFNCIRKTCTISYDVYNIYSRYYLLCSTVLQFLFCCADPLNYFCLTVQLDQLTAVLLFLSSSAEQEGWLSAVLFCSEKSAFTAKLHSSAEQHIPLKYLKLNSAFISMLHSSAKQHVPFSYCSAKLSPYCGAALSN